MTSTDWQAEKAKMEAIIAVVNEQFTGESAGADVIKALCGVIAMSLCGCPFCGHPGVDDDMLEEWYKWIPEVVRRYVEGIKKGLIDASPGHSH
jgi:hypothetical protein